MQPFKRSDQKEEMMRDAALPLLQLLGGEFDNFYNGAYTCYKLGDVFVNLNCSPLADVIPPSSFRACFFAIHEMFTRPGTFEFYLDVFRALFGETVDVEFVVPSPGKLEINIASLQYLTEDFLARSIVDNIYEYDEVIDHNGDNLVFQGSIGISTPEEVNAMVREIHPIGVYVEANLEFIEDEE